MRLWRDGRGQPGPEFAHMASAIMDPASGPPLGLMTVVHWASRGGGRPTSRLRAVTGSPERESDDVPLAPPWDDEGPNIAWQEHI